MCLAGFMHVLPIIEIFLPFKSIADDSFVVVSSK